MLRNYNRLFLSKQTDSDSCECIFKSAGVTGLEWNQYIGRIIINDFIKQLDDHVGTEFAPYMGVLPFIEYGMFQSAIGIISEINIPGLEKLKSWLLESLKQGEDRYE